MEIHIERKNTTLIAIKRTFLGLVPARANNHDAKTFATLYCDKASPNVKPANKIIIVDDHIVPKISVEAAAAPITLPSSSFSTLKGQLEGEPINL